MSQIKILTLLILPLTIALLGLACSKQASPPSGSGFIEATEVVISAQVSGRVEHLYVAEGDRIRTGEPIVLIDTTSLALKVAQAEAKRAAIETRIHSAEIRVEQALLDSSLAAREFQRVSNLIASGSVREKRYDEVETHYRQASLAAGMARATLKANKADLRHIEAEINLVKEQLANCKPTSPISGTIMTTYIKRGELATTGKPLVRIANLDTVWVKIYLNPEDLGKVMLGDVAEVDPEIPGMKPLSGHVTWMASEAEFTPKNVQTKEARADLVYAIKVTIPNPEKRLKIGMPVMVRIPQ